MRPIRLPTALFIALLLFTFSSSVSAKIAISTVRSGPAAPATRPVASPNLLRLEKVSLATFSPDGRILMTVADADRQVHFWSTQTGEEVNRFGVGVTAAIFSASGNRVMTWGEDRVVRIFDTRTGKALRRLQGGELAPRAAALSPDGSRALTSAPGQAAITLWDTQSGQSLGTLEGHTSPVTALAFAPDGTRALSLAGEIAQHGRGPVFGKPPTTAPAAATTDFSLRYWDLASRKVIRTIPLPVPAQSPDFSRDGSLACVVVGPNPPRIYDLATGAEPAAPLTPQQTFPAADFTPDRKTGLSRAIGSAAITNASTGDRVRPLEAPIDGLPICHAFSDDGSRVILGTGKVNLFSRNPNEPGSVYVYDVATGKRLATFTGHAREVTLVALSAGGAAAISRDADRTLFLWMIPAEKAR